MPILVASIIWTSTAVATISYELRNDRSSALFVFDQLYKTDRSGNRTASPSLAYVTQEKGSVVVGKFLVSIPYGVKVESPELPYLVQVQPGATISGQITLSFPLRTWIPYRQSSLDELSQKPDPKQITLRIGYIDSRSSRPDRPIVYASPHGVICDYGYGLKFQEYAQSILAVPPH